MKTITDIDNEIDRLDLERERLYDERDKLIINKFNFKGKYLKLINEDSSIFYLHVLNISPVKDKNDWYISFKASVLSYNLEKTFDFSNIYYTSYDSYSLRIKLNDLLTKKVIITVLDKETYKKIYLESISQINKELIKNYEKL